MKTHEGRSKVAETLLERYGVKHNSQTDSYRSSVQRTNIERYGVPWAIQAPSIQEKAQDTSRERYGVSHYVKTGVPSRVSRNPDARVKRWESLKANGTIRASRVENAFIEELQSIWGAGVKRHQYINGWCIDAYVEQLDCWVQFDGVFWHGLDRPMEQILQYKNEVDRIIRKKWETDRNQEMWFSASGRRLVRVTDRQYDEYLAGAGGSLKDWLRKVGIII